MTPQERAALKAAEAYVKAHLKYMEAVLGFIDCEEASRRFKIKERAEAALIRTMSALWTKRRVARKGRK